MFSSSPRVCPAAVATVKAHMGLPLDGQVGSCVPKRSSCPVGVCNAGLETKSLKSRLLYRSRVDFATKQAKMVEIVRG